MFGKQLGSGFLCILAALAMAACDADITRPAVAAPEAPLRTLTSTTTPAFQDGFETGARATAQGGYRWTAPGAKSGDGVSITRERARTGAYSLKFLYGADARLCDDSWAEQRFELGENLTEVWFEYYVYFPNGTEGNVSKFVHRQPTKRNADGNCSTQTDVDTNNKFFALWDVDYKTADTRILVEYRRSQTGLSGDSNLYGMWCSDTRTCGAYNWPGGRWDPAITDATRGRWLPVRIHVRASDTKESKNGMLQIWVDGALRVNMQNLDLAPAVGGNRFFRNGYLMGWSNSGFSKTTAVYVDDFKIFRTNPGW